VTILTPFAIHYIRHDALAMTGRAGALVVVAMSVRPRPRAVEVSHDLVQIV